MKTKVIISSDNKNDLEKMLNKYYYSNNYAVVLATSKKEALRFAKDYEGLKIGSKVKGSSKDVQYEIDDFMNIQSIKLDELLKNNIVEFSR